MKKAKGSKKKQQRQIEVVNSDTDSEGEPQQGKLNNRSYNFRYRIVMNFKANSKFLLKRVNV